MEQAIEWVGVMKVTSIICVELWCIFFLLYVFYFTGHKGRVLHIALSPDQGRLFSVAADGIACLWKCRESGESKNSSMAFSNGYLSSVLWLPFLESKWLHVFNPFNYSNHVRSCQWKFGTTFPERTVVPISPSCEMLVACLSLEEKYYNSEE